MGDAFVVIVAVVAGMIILRRRRSPHPVPPPKRPSLRLQARVFTVVLLAAGVLYVTVKLFN